MSLINKDKATISDNNIHEFYKHRKILSCISDGISMYTNNMGKYAIATFIPTAIIAIIISIYAFLLLKHRADETFTLQSFLQDTVTWATVILITLFLALYTCVSYVFIEHICIHKHILGLRQMYMISFKRFLRVFFFNSINICTYAIAGIFLYYIYTENYDFLAIGRGVVATLLIILLSLPYNTILPTLMLENAGFLKGFIKGYKLGFSIWVKTIALFILLFFIKLIFGAILFTPALVHFAIFKSYIDALINGDNAYLPEIFIISFAIITFLTTFILLYFATALNLPYTYLYSSAITDKKENENNYIPIV